jgi:hypothetical protein
MSKNVKRRTFLGNSIVLSSGLAVGAFSAESLAEAPATQSRKLFLHKSDKRLHNKELRSLFNADAPISLQGITYKGSQFTQLMKADGTIVKEMDDGRKEKGQWSIKKDELVMKFPTIAGGEQIPLQIYRFKKGNLYKAWSPSTGRWSWFVI